MTRSDGSGMPVECRHCHIPVVDTEIGLMHLDSQGRLAGWLCPPQYMTLATRPDPLDSMPPPSTPSPAELAKPLQSTRELTPVPAVSKRRHVPDPPPQLPY